MDDIIEIRNVVSPGYQDFIHEKVTSLQFPWYFNTNLVTPEATLKDEANIQGFNHFLFEEQKQVSPTFDSIFPLYLSIVDQLKGTDIKFNLLERMRFNLTYANPLSTLPWHMPHIDSMYPHYNAIYYVNDSDGDTVIFNETNEDYSEDFDVMKENKFTVKQRITPEKGKVVVFPGHYYHASSFAKKSNYRCVLNINLGKVF
jgi:hypothetical protein